MKWNEYVLPPINLYNAPRLGNYSMTTIFYIHGFGSSSKGDTAMMFSAYAKQYGYKFYAYDYDFSQNDPEYILNDIICTRRAIRGGVIFVGSSLGGFFANRVAKFMGDPVLLVNPTMFPSVSLKKYGVSADILRQFRIFEYSYVSNKVVRTVVCGLNDDVVDPNTNGRMLDGKVINIEMGHRIEESKMDFLMKEIDELDNTIIETNTDFT
jgi:hypothetical protein